MLKAIREATATRQRMKNRAKVPEPKAVKMPTSLLSASCKDQRDDGMSSRAKIHMRTVEPPWDEDQGDGAGASH